MKIFVRVLCYTIASIISALVTGCSIANNSLENKVLQNKYYCSNIGNSVNWTISGKVSINFPGKHGTFFFICNKENKLHSLTILSPLGYTISVIKNLEFSFGNNALQKYKTGSSGLYPIFSYMTFWMRGLPAPNKKGKVYFDLHGNISKLKQGVWEVHYLDFFRKEDYCLPKILKISNKIAGLNINLVIEKWKIKF